MVLYFDSIDSWDKPYFINQYGNFTIVAPKPLEFDLNTISDIVFANSIDLLENPDQGLQGITKPFKWFNSKKEPYTNLKDWLR